MNFCLSIDHGEWSHGSSVEATTRTIEYARLADSSGFDSIWLNEDPDGWDAFAVLGALSQTTDSVRLGTGVTNYFNRNPNLIAASVATLDRLSAGRAFLGIGRGQTEVYSQTFGLNTERPLEQLENAIDLLRQWWGETHTAAGSGLGASWSRAFGPTHQPPIYIAAVGPRALQLAGRCADGVLFNEMATPDFVRWAVSTTIESARQAGRSPDQLRFFVNPATRVSDDPASILERKKTFMAMVHALPGMDRLLMTDKWDVPGIMEGVRRAMRTDDVLAQGGHFIDIRRGGDLDLARSLIPLELVEESSAIGPPDFVRQKLSQYVVAGATDLFVDRRGLPADPSAAAELLASIRPAPGSGIAPY